MNERIEELAKQCTEQIIDYDVGTMYDQVDHRKFAELIVRECAERLMQDDFGSVKGVMSIAGARLKEHFGVK